MSDQSVPVLRVIPIGGLGEIGMNLMVYEFGDAIWVKSIVTTSHNNQVVELEDLVSDDPDDPADVNWTNGEPDEVEVEWQILQTEFNNPDGNNNELAGGLEADRSVRTGQRNDLPAFLDRLPAKLGQAGQQVADAARLFP